MDDVTQLNYDIPEDVHRKAKAAASLRGMTLRDWLIEIVGVAAMEELRKQVG